MSIFHVDDPAGREAHLIGNSLLSSIVDGGEDSVCNSGEKSMWPTNISNDFDRPMNSLSDISQSDTANIHKHNRRSSLTSCNSTVGPSCSMEWESLYSPFGTLPNGDVWMISQNTAFLNQRVIPNNYDGRVSALQTSQQLESSRNITPAEFQQSGSGVQNFNTPISYRDVACKNSAAKIPMVARNNVNSKFKHSSSTYANVVANRRFSVGVAPNLNDLNRLQQSSSDSLSETSLNVGTTNVDQSKQKLSTKDSDCESEHSSVQSSSANLTSQSQKSIISDKRTNFFRKNIDLTGGNPKLVAFTSDNRWASDFQHNTFTKNATTVTDIEHLQLSTTDTSKAGAFENKSSIECGDDVRSECEKSQIVTQELNNNRIIEKNVKRQHSGRKFDYIKNDLSPECPEKSNDNSFQCNNVSMESFVENDTIKSQSPVDVSSRQTSKMKKNFNKTAVGGSSGGGGGVPFLVNDKLSLKFVAKRSKVTNDTSSTDRRRRRDESALISSFNSFVVTLALYLQNAMLWFFDLVTDIVTQLFDITVHCVKFMYAEILRLALYCFNELFNYFRQYWSLVRQKEWKFSVWWRSCRKKEDVGFGLDQNITLPNTSDEAMSRLFLCRGQDAYSILGVRSGCSDDEIKHYYRRQAVLVHPDKNLSYGAEEAFKILAAAFELVSTPQLRAEYDMQNFRKTKVMKDLEEMFAKLREKMEEVRSTMQCDCGKKHKRFDTHRELSSARYCRRCKTHHAAQSGDIWAESFWYGFVWYYFACMDGMIYDITEWAGCHRNNLQHMRANDHLVKYRLSTNSKQNDLTGKRGLQSKSRARDSITQNDNGDFLNRLLNGSLEFGASATQRDTNTASPTTMMHSKFQPPPFNPGDDGRPRKNGRRRKNK